MEYTVLYRHQGHARRRRRRRRSMQSGEDWHVPSSSFNFIHSSPQPTSPSRDRPFSPQAPLFFSSTTTTTATTPLPLIDTINRLINQSFNNPLHSILPFLFFFPAILVTIPSSSDFIISCDVGVFFFFLLLLLVVVMVVVENVKDPSCGLESSQDSISSHQ